MELDIPIGEERENETSGMLDWQRMIEGYPSACFDLIPDNQQATHAPK